MRRQTKLKRRYFLEDEYAETLSSSRVHSLISIQKAVYKTQVPGGISLERKEYIYECSGAKYEGEWLGGFRHGRGTMTWSDGATFVGDWVLGRVVG